MNSQATTEIYRNSWEHLQDELQGLELRLQLLKNQQQSAEAREDKHLQESLTRLEAHIATKLKISLAQGIYLALPHLAQIFGCNAFETRCILTCLAPELNQKYARLFGQLQDDSQSQPTVDLVIQLYCTTVEEQLLARLAFVPEATLKTSGLIHISDTSSQGSLPQLAWALKLDERIVNFLLGIEGLDAQLTRVARLSWSNQDDQANWSMTSETIRVRGLVSAFLAQPGIMGNELIFYCYGSPGAGKRTLAQTVALELGLPLLWVDAAKLLESDSPYFELSLLRRELMLRPALLGVEHFEALLNEEKKAQAVLDSLIGTIRSAALLTFICSNQPWHPNGLFEASCFMVVELSVPEATVRRQIWERLQEEYSFAEAVDWEAVAGKFRFTPGQIKAALVDARNLAWWRLGEVGQIATNDLYQACRNQSTGKLGRLAVKVVSQNRWEDLILPPETQQQLQEIEQQLQYSLRVYSEWGFGAKLSNGKGLSALFYGAPGTGKTMAAGVIAGAVGLDLYTIDLSQVVSKYIGETEKNLEQIFYEAQCSQAILFFDEADALFGKRTEVKDAHDRHANVETAYLLQKMEEYEGMTILATNLNQNLDEAFRRRLHFTVEFPFPDQKQRSMLWQQIFPQQAPLAPDLDYEFLATRLSLSGGNIKNIALRAAFYAAAAYNDIGMKQIIRAARWEYRKMGKPFVRNDFEPYYRLLEE